MKPYFKTPLGALYMGDCLEVMRGLPKNSIDTLVTDAPYGLSFMGKKWDYDVPGAETWRECLRVLKPGATALIFAGSRTQHRMAVNIEDAGFILKDTIMWIYGQGFPKSTNISKQIDKKAGKERVVIGRAKRPDGSHRINISKKPGTSFRSGSNDKNITAAATPEAELWDGWHSHGLKPAYEPILVCQKPNDGTYAQNALKHGVSGLNIDGGRIPVDQNDNIHAKNPHTKSKKSSVFGKAKGVEENYNPNKGRWPANIILDEESGRILDKQSGVLKSGARNKFFEPDKRQKQIFKNLGGGFSKSSQGGASRFFYCAKASAKGKNSGSKEIDYYELKKEIPIHIEKEIKQLLSV